MITTNVPTPEGRSLSVPRHPLACGVGYTSDPNANVFLVVYALARSGESTQFSVLRRFSSLVGPLGLTVAEYSGQGCFSPSRLHGMHAPAVNAGYYAITFRRSSLKIGAAALPAIVPGGSITAIATEGEEHTRQTAALQDAENRAQVLEAATSQGWIYSLTFPRSLAEALQRESRWENAFGAPGLPIASSGDPLAISPAFQAALKGPWEKFVSFAQETPAGATPIPSSKVGPSSIRTG